MSDAPYDTLNMGLHVGDAPWSVVANRERAFGALGLRLDDSVSAEQVHGNRVAVVDEFHAGAGARAYETALSGVDGLITASSKVVLAAYFADCLPVFLADRRGRFVALVHAGWKGSLARITAEALGRLRELGVSPGDVFVAFGPSIRPCCYEVGADLAERFAGRFGPSVVQRSTRGAASLDLARVNAVQCLEAGVPEEQIEHSDECTACLSERYYSHRAQGPKTGRMAGLIALA